MRASIFRACAASGVALGSMLARTVVPNAWEAPNDLENSEDCRSAGGHGNQHVRLRCAQIVSIKSIRPAAKQRSAPGRFSVSDLRVITTAKFASFLRIEEVEFGVAISEIGQLSPALGPQIIAPSLPASNPWIVIGCLSVGAAPWLWI